jgi:hypothetical protein
MSKELQQDSRLPAENDESGSRTERLGRRALMLGAATGAGVVAVGVMAGADPAEAATSRDDAARPAHVCDCPSDGADRTAGPAGRLGCGHVCSEHLLQQPADRVAAQFHQACPNRSVLTRSLG